MRVVVLTLFPGFFESPFKTSILSRALGFAGQAAAIECELVSLREFGEGAYRAVDDRPFGGGAGMVLMPSVLESALQSILSKTGFTLDQLEKDVQSYRQSKAAQTRSGLTGLSDPSFPMVLFCSPQGRIWNAESGRTLASRRQNLILICGHYEGIDQRAIDAFVHEEVSIGDYVLSGGETAALVMIETLVRFLPGVIGDPQSVAQDCFEKSATDMISGGLKAPVFTRPKLWRGKEVPEVLLSGNHGAIEKWRKQESLSRTKTKRPDLLLGGGSTLDVKK